MTTKELANLLTGIQYGEELSMDVLKKANDNNLVIITGYSDDVVCFEGSMHDELSAYDGATIMISRNGLVYNQDDEDIEEALEVLEDKGFRVISFHTFKQIEAIWSPEDIDTSWAFETEIPHSKFNVMEGDELFCEGIVISLDDI